MEIREIEKDIAIPFIRQYHYSKIMPHLTKHYLGFFEHDELCGVVTLGWGTQPLATIKKLFYKHNLQSNDYFEIGKMCFHPSCNGNKSFGSQVISMTVKWMRRNTDCCFLYTLADGIMGKCGYVYQASNFRYIGNFKTSVYRDVATGEKIHPRSSRQLCIENAQWEGKEKVFWLTDAFCKYKGIDKINGLMFRYIYPINSYGKRIFAAYPEYQNKHNPKDGDLVFERRVANGKFEKIPQPEFNMNVFNYNCQKG